MTKEKIVAGIDIGGTNVLIGIVNQKGQILNYKRIKTSDYPLPEDLVDKACRLIHESLLELGNDYILNGVGIGAPNGNYYTGTVDFAPNMNWKGVVHLKNLFESRLNTKAVITNDANAAALGEMLFGAAKGMNDFIFITLGTGLGSGIVVDGKLLYGHDGFAGEIGHIILYPDGRECGCGRRGCVETYCSATGLKKTYAELKLQRDSNYHIESFKLEAKSLYDLALKGDDIASLTFQITGERLGLVLANAVAFSSPEAIFLFGGLMSAGDLILNPVKQSFEKNLLNIYKGKVKLLLSSLNENDAAILGAASLAWNEFND